MSLEIGPMKRAYSLPFVKLSAHALGSDARIAVIAQSMVKKGQLVKRPVFFEELVKKTTPHIMHNLGEK